jgi:hypothetical protein
MPVFVRWMAPLVTIFLLAVLLKAPDKIVIVTFMLCITTMVAMFIRAVIIAKDTPRVKKHHGSGKSVDWNK